MQIQKGDDKWFLKTLIAVLLSAVLSLVVYVFNTDAKQNIAIASTQDQTAYTQQSMVQIRDELRSTNSKLDRLIELNMHNK